MEHEIEGTWQKFLNNDGLDMGGEENQFKLKALAFAHWTFNKFDGRRLIVLAPLSREPVPTQQLIHF